MIEAAQMAGFLAAHAVWCISDGETLVPMYGYIKGENEQVMERLVHERLEEAVAAGQEKLSSNPYSAPVAVLIYDGRITLESGKKDALIIEFRTYGNREGSVFMALPYTPAGASGKFAVHRPKIIACSDNLKDSLESVGENFFQGVGQHEKGAKIWNDHLDETI